MRNVRPARAVAIAADWHLRAFRERTALAAVGAAVLTPAFVWLVVRYETHTPVLLLSAVLAALVLARPICGVYFAWTFLMLFELGGPDLLMEPGAHFTRSLEAGLALDGVVITPLEVLLAITAAGVYLQRRRAGRPLERGGLFRPVVLFSAFLVVGMVRGIVEGGDINTGFWELRCLAYLVLCYFIAANSVNSPRAVGTLLVAAIAASTALAAEMIYRRLAIVNTGQLYLAGVAREHAFGHESAVLLAAVLLLVVTGVLLQRSWAARLLSVACAPVLAVGLLSAERRAGFIALGVTAALVSIVLLAAQRRTFVTVALPLLLAGALYVPLFWNSTGIWGHPARAVRSLVQPDMRDAASNQYRVLEHMNLRATLQEDALMGVGFGRPFKFVVPLPDLSWWPFWRYEPHNNILWIWLKTGAAGFVCFWLLMGSTLSRATLLFRTLKESTLRAFALFTLGLVAIMLTFCWVDLGLVSMRLTVIVGTALGVLGVLERIQERATASAVTR